MKINIPNKRYIIKILLKVFDILYERKNFCVRLRKVLTLVNTNSKIYLLVNRQLYLSNYQALNMAVLICAFFCFTIVTIQ